jgi:3-oxoacyl-[acyl-carrier protein] reductase
MTRGPDIPGPDIPGPDIPGPDIPVPGRFPATGEVDGRRVVITGSSRGLGRVLAIAFARAGATVGLVGRDGDALARVRAELGGTQHLTFTGDVTDEAFNESIVDTMVAERGGLDAWIGNAGISPTVRASDALPGPVWDEVIATNLTGAFLGARCAARAMGPGGRIILTGSVLGQRAMPGLAAYAAAKSGLGALVRTMALELGGRGITVNCVAPGWFDSPLTEGWRASVRREEQIVNHTALGRWGTAADLPGAFLFLASPAAAFITGVTLPVDGGYLLR